MRRIALLGLSGVGKSTMLGALATQLTFTHLEASRLIRAEQARRSLAPQSSEALRIGSVLDNQALLIAGFEHEAALTDLPIIFDGHSVIDGREDLIEIPAEVFAALGLDAICFLRAEPSDILARRQNDTARLRPARTVEALGEHQEQAIAVAMTIADRLDCPFSLITNEDSAILVAYVAGETP